GRLCRLSHANRSLSRQCAAGAGAGAFGGSEERGVRGRRGRRGVEVEDVRASERRWGSVVDGGEPPAAALEGDEAGDTVVGHELEASLATLSGLVPPTLLHRPRTGPRHDGTRWTV